MVLFKYIYIFFFLSVSAKLKLLVRMHLKYHLSLNLGIRSFCLQWQAMIINLCFPNDSPGSLNVQELKKRTFEGKQPFSSLLDQIFMLQNTMLPSKVSFIKGCGEHPDILRNHHAGCLEQCRVCFSLFFIIFLYDCNIFLCYPEAFRNSVIKDYITKFDMIWHLMSKWNSYLQMFFNITLQLLALSMLEKNTLVNPNRKKKNKKKDFANFLLLNFLCIHVSFK